MSRLPLFAMAAMACMASATLAAEPPKPLGSFGSWQAFAAGGIKPTACYVSSQPTKVEPKGIKRGDVFLLVSFRKGTNGQPNVANEVSVIAGYSYKEQSEVTLAAGGTDFMLFTQGDGAWARDGRTDESIVAALKRAQTVTVKGVSTRGVATTDTYALKGFEAALGAATKACAIKSAG